MKLKILTSSLIMLSTLVGAVPERPVIDRTIHMAEGHVAGGEDRHWLNPYIPPLTTSLDSRIGLTHRPYRGVYFRLLKPEKIDQPFLESEPGMEIMHSADIYDNDYTGVTNPSSAIPSRSNNGHMAICDPSGDFPELTGNTHNSPYACGETGTDDCYDLAVITQLGNDRLASTHVHVRVSNPKTVDAEIVEITTGNTIEGNTAFPGGAFFEPSITGDGHLMVSRTDIGRNSNISDMVYFVADNPDQHPACDARQFTHRRNIGHAPYDDTINTRYGFAMHPFQTLDNSGNVYVLPDNARFGTYPWIDKSGANITFSSLGGRVSSAGFDTRCPPEVEARYSGNCSANAENSPINGRTLMGLWTKGKMVLLDNMLNHMDHMEDVRETGHVDVRIYDPTNDPRDGYKRVGDSRSRNIDVMPNGNVTNSSFFDSNEHRFNYHQNMKPITPADVTWLMSTGRSTDEVPFDDYLNVNGFIVSHMVQALRFNAQYNVRGALNGRIQNSATSPDWNKPTSARMVGGGRAEIVANGGIVGKGYWLDGQNIALQYDIPLQNEPASVLNTPWFYGLFIDSRNNTGERALLTFPDNSEIRLRGNNTLVFINGAGAQVHTVTTPTNIPSTGWIHLGFQLSQANQRIVTYINGYQVDVFTNNSALFVLNQGTLTLGANDNINASFRGWIDDFKVFAENVNKEVACNLAKGTLAGVNGNAPAYWRNLANAHDTQAHYEISSVIADPMSQYVCYHNYSDDYAAHLQNIPNGLVGIREAVNFPEGPLYYDRPRPESRGNTFCLSCHTEDGRGGLDLEALAFDPNTLAPYDHRRQPMQPDARVFGNIPANWLGQGIPAQAFVANEEEGFYIDQWLLSASDGQPDEPDTPANPATNVTLTVVDTSLYVGETVSSNVNVAPSNADDTSVTYTSSDHATATVDANGVISALGAGTAVISAHTVNGLVDSITMTVSELPTEEPDTPEEPDSLLLNPGFEQGNDSWTINGGEISNISYTGANAVLINGNGGANQQLVLQPNTQYTFSVCGRVGGSGQRFYMGVTNLSTNTFIENALFISTAYTQQTITFTTGNNSDNYNFWIWNNQGGQYFADNFILENINSVSPANPPTSVQISATANTLFVGETAEVSAVIAPSDADDLSITYSSSNSNIATVDSNGLVRAIAAGTANITAETSNGLTDSVVITISTQQTPPTGEPEPLATTSTYVNDSGNWDNSRVGNVHDDNLIVEARGTSDGANETTWTEYQFPTASQFEFAVREDNAPSFQISRWKVQGYISGQWTDITNWVNANVNGWTYTEAENNVTTNRIRLVVEAPNGQRVGLREFDATGVIH